MAAGDTLVEINTKLETDSDDQQVDLSPHREPSNSPTPPSPDDRTRLYLALMMGALLIVLALAAVLQPTAGAVLDKVLPLLTLVLGYFFGQEVHR